jgi:hypothetical protein
MNPYFAVMLLVGLLVVGWRFMRPKRERAVKSEGVRRPERKVEGFQVWGPLHVRLSRGCIQDFGMQFGPGFRRKDGPMLPHDPHCQCETVPFAFKSSEVFGGALRRVGEPRSLEPEIPTDAVPKVMAVLKRANAEVLPPDADGYVALMALDTAEGMDATLQPAVEAFLRRRYAFLKGELAVGDVPQPALTESASDPEGGRLAAPAAKTP